jgi:hypothetical protein
MASAVILAVFRKTDTPGTSSILAGGLRMGIIDLMSRTTRLLPVATVYVAIVGGVFAVCRAHDGSDDYAAGCRRSPASRCRPAS